MRARERRLRTPAWRGRTVASTGPTTDQGNWLGCGRDYFGDSVGREIRNPSAFHRRIGTLDWDNCLEPTHQRLSIDGSDAGWSGQPAVQRFRGSWPAGYMCLWGLLAPSPWGAS